jgi:hypothetical protein
MLRFYISIKNNLIIGVVVKKLLWSQNRAHFVEFGVNRLYNDLRVCIVNADRTLAYLTIASTLM